MKYIIATLVGVAILLGFAPAAQAAPASSLPTISVYTPSSGFGDEVRYGTRQWNAAGDVRMVQVSTPCSGTMCVIVEEVAAHYPGTCLNYIGGCEWSDPTTGTMHVTVTNNFYLVANRKVDQANLRKSVTLHELGHTLGLNHRDPAQDPATCMASMIIASNPIMRPSAQDLAIVNEMWADGYQAPAA